jgi:hypothetical protein
MTPYSIQKFILGDPSNTSRLVYVGQLFKWANRLEEESMKAEITTFASETKTLLLLSIQPPTLSDVELLVQEAGTVFVIRDM